jgi:hypothetical protein
LVERLQQGERKRRKSHECDSTGGQPQNAASSAPNLPHCEDAANDARSAGDSLSVPCSACVMRPPGSAVLADAVFR